jgi:hypothetical protein
MRGLSWRKWIAIVLAVVVIGIAAVQCGSDLAASYQTAARAPGVESLLADVVVPCETMGAPQRPHDFRLAEAGRGFTALPQGGLAVDHARVKAVFISCLLAADESQPKRLLSMRRNHDTKYKDLLKLPYGKSQSRVA